MNCKMKPIIPALHNQFNRIIEKMGGVSYSDMMNSERERIILKLIRKIEKTEEREENIDYQRINKELS